MTLNREKHSKYIFIKFIKIILFASVSFLVNNYYHKKYDNNINLIFFENNIDFSNYSTDIKAIAICIKLRRKDLPNSC